MNITILGASGFMGANLTIALANAGYTVRCFDRKGSFPLSLRHGWKNVSFHEGDFFSRNDLLKVLEGCEICFHLISTSVPVTSNAAPARDAQENIVGTLQLLDIARDEGVKKIIFPSSGGAIYGKTRVPVIDEKHPTVPLSSYGIAKLAIERYLALYHELYGLDYVALRIANPYGPFQRLESCQGIVGVFLGCAIADKPLSVWGDGTVVRDYIFIEDLIGAFLAAMRVTPREKVFNLGSGAGLSVNQLIDSLRRVTGKSLAVDYCEARELEIPYSVLDISRARHELGWEPKTDFEQGLRKTWEWAKCAC